jgi:glutathione S-transferase
MTSNIVLYGNRPVTSPYVMAVFVALEEKGLPFEFRQLDLVKGEHLDPAYVNQSITNRIPTLLCDGQSFSESSAITEFLEERFAPPNYARTYPQDLVERARVRMVQALIRSDFMPIRMERATDTFFDNAPIKPLSDEAEKAKSRLERIASTLVGDGRQYIATDFSIADVDLSTMLQRLCANNDPMPKVLSDYANRVWARPSIRKWLALTNFKSRV